MRSQLPALEVSEGWARARAWDLVVCADHCFGGTTRRSPAVYIGHGSPNKVLAGETTGYVCSDRAYDRKGRPLYARIFLERDEEKSLALASCHGSRDIFRVVGSMEHDDLLAQADRRDEFRLELGYKPRDVVVLILSTWGEHCLFHTMGDELLEEARKMRGEFKFILSAHPHEYRPKPAGQRVWGEYLRSQREFGFVVREPSESWISYLVASDIVLSDYTCLAQSAVLLEKPIILTPVPEELIWRGSVTWKIRQFAPILNDARELRQALTSAMNTYPMEKLHELAKSMNPHPGEAAVRIRKEIYDLLGIPGYVG
ncbi:MAG: hypothetical protein JW720_08555 [Sedimentisphaerales bacterium]|nr:hypothetical protein [Sedimentisphaerales bacterium]